MSELVSFTSRGTLPLRRNFKLQEYIPPSFMLISLRTNEVDSEIPSFTKVSVRFSPSLDNHKLFSVVDWLPLNVMLQKIVAETEWSTVRLETVTLGMSLSERKRRTELLLPESYLEQISTVNKPPKDDITMISQWYHNDITMSQWALNV